MALLVVIGQRMPGIIDHPAFQDEWIWLLAGIPDHVSATQLVMVELCRISQVTVGNESHVYCQFFAHFKVMSFCSGVMWTYSV